MKGRFLKERRYKGAFYPGTKQGLHKLIKKGTQNLQKIQRGRAVRCVVFILLSLSNVERKIFIILAHALSKFVQLWKFGG